MVTQNSSSNPYDLPPLTEGDLDDDTNTFALSSDTLQLQVDVLNVTSGRVDINTFPPDYQIKIKNYYRFSATRQNSKVDNVAPRTVDTLDII